MFRLLLGSVAMGVLLFGTQAVATPEADGPTKKVDIPLDEVGFTAYARDRILLLHPGAKVTIDGPLLLTVDGDDRIGLGRIHDFCTRVPDHCAEELNTFVAALTEVRETQSYDAALLRSVVRPHDYVSGVQAQFAARNEAVVARSFAGDLDELCVFDRPKTTETVMQRHLAQLGLAADALFSRCEANVAATEMLDGVRDLPLGGIDMLVGDYYQSSLVTAHEAWRSVAARFGGKLLVVVPDPTVIIYAHGDSPELIARLLEIGKRAIQDSERPLSTEVLAWTPDGWKVVSAP